MKEEWYDQLQAAVSKVPQHDVLLIMGDMNAKTGSDNTDRERAMGREGCGIINDNGLLLVVSLHQSDPLSDKFVCDIVVNHDIIKRACLSQQRELEEMLHCLISFFTITRGVILICIFPLS